MHVRSTVAAFSLCVAATTLAACGGSASTEAAFCAAAGPLFDPKQSAYVQPEELDGVDADRHWWDFLEAQYAGLVAAAPPEIEQAARTVEASLNGLVDLFESYDWDTMSAYADPTVEQVLANDDVVAADEVLNRYVEDICGIETGVVPDESVPSPR